MKQLLLRRKIKFATSQEDESFIALSREGTNNGFMTSCNDMHYILGTLTVTSDSCHCKFATTMKLPCRHVFAVHEKQELPLYTPDGIAERWKLMYLKEVFGNKCTANTESSSYEVCCAATCNLCIKFEFI